MPLAAMAAPTVAKMAVKGDEWDRFRYLAPMFATKMSFMESSAFHFQSYGRATFQFSFGITNPFHTVSHPPT